MTQTPSRFGRPPKCHTCSVQRCDVWLLLPLLRLQSQVRCTAMQQRRYALQGRSVKMLVKGRDFRAARRVLLRAGRQRLDESVLGMLDRLLDCDVVRDTLQRLPGSEHLAGLSDAELQGKMVLLLEGSFRSLPHIIVKEHRGPHGRRGALSDCSRLPHRTRAPACCLSACALSKSNQSLTQECTDHG